LFIPNPDPDFVPIPDPGSRIQGPKRHRIPDPGSGSATLESRHVYIYWRFLLEKDSGLTMTELREKNNFDNTANFIERFSF
jgi:hypothetical protein